MELSEAIKNRRSIRSFKPDPIPEKDLTKIFNAGRWAPSSGNTQPLEMVIIKNEKRKKKLAEAAGGQSFIAEAPIAIVACANIPRTAETYGDRGRNMYIFQDTATAIQNILLRAYSLGYGTCWIGSFHDEEVSKVIKAPEWIRPLAIVPIGRADEDPEAPPRRELEEITHEGTFSENNEGV